MKTCSRCNTEKETAAFGKYTRGNDGLQAWCKPCCAEDRRARFEADPKKVRASKLASFYKHHDKALASGKAYRDSHKDEERARIKRWEDENPDKVKAKYARYRKNNPDKVAVTQKQWVENNREAKYQVVRRHEAKKRRSFVENVDMDILFERDFGDCGICSKPIDRLLRHPDPMSLSLDHVIPVAKDGEHSYANTQIAHLVCNKRKGNRQ